MATGGKERVLARVSERAAADTARESVRQDSEPT